MLHRYRLVRKTKRWKLKRRWSASVNAQVSKLSYLSFFESIPIGLYRSTPEGRFLDANPAMIAMLGYPDIESLRKICIQDLYVNLQERDQQQALLDKTGVVQHAEIRLYRQDGSMIWVKDNLRKTQDHFGNIIYEGSLEDITQRKAVEAALSQSEAELRAALDNNLMGFILINQDHRISKFNRKANELSSLLFGFRLQEGNSILEHLSKEDQIVFINRFNQAFNGNPGTEEYFTQLPDGMSTWYEFHWEPASTNLNQVVGVSFSGIDITSRKIAEQRIQQLYEAEREQREMAEALQETSLVLGFTLDIETILDRILEQVAKVVPYDVGRVLLLDSRQARVVRFKVSDAFDLPEVNQQAQKVFDLDQTSNLKWVLEHAQPLIIAETYEYPGWIRYKGIESIHSWIGLPIQIHGEMMAILSLSKAESNFYQPEQVKKLAAFASQTALALQHALLFETIQQRAKEAEMLRLATAAVTNELDLEQTLEKILENLKRVIQYDSATIFLLNDAELTIVAARGFSNEHKVIGQTFPADNLLFHDSLTTGSAIILADAAQDHRFEQWIDGEPVHGWIGVPLHLRGRAIGFLTIDSHEVNAYSESQATLAQAFANEVTIALENARLFKELQNLATTDPLTEVWNRRHFINMARTEFQRARRFHQPLSIILFDIDSFKNVNDNYGHPAGDQVLCSMAKVCRENLRQVDLFGRYGGEEFIALLPNTSIETARSVAERLRNRIASTPMPTDQGLIHISASFGVAEMDESCLDIDTLLKYADRAAYVAKFDGKNRVSISENGYHQNF
jgi:diguanylate cyclase (GGDEF)-like protein/PAS domain S-box-containing protein